MGWERQGEAGSRVIGTDLVPTLPATTLRPQESQSCHRDAKVLLPAQKPFKGNHSTSSCLTGVVHSICATRVYTSAILAQDTSVFCLGLETGQNSLSQEEQT